VSALSLKKGKQYFLFTEKKLIFSEKIILLCEVLWQDLVEKLNDSMCS